MAATPAPGSSDTSRLSSSSSSSSAGFDVRKARIMAGIASTDPDASPKGSIDTHILPLISRLNSHADVVTTSSCSGRISVFLEGAKKIGPEAYSTHAHDRGHDCAAGAGHPGRGEHGRLQGLDRAAGGDEGKVEVEEITPEGEMPSSRPNAGVGGKGDGGRWLFVSHDPVDINSTAAAAAATDGPSDAQLADKVLGRNPDDDDGVSYSPCHHRSRNQQLSFATRFVHFKFEPMILHIQTRTLEVAHAILSTALSTGFRESGVMNVALKEKKNQFPMVAIRSNGLAMDSIIGIVDDVSGKVRRVVEVAYIAMLVRVGNMRFRENAARMEKLAANLDRVLFVERPIVRRDGGGWEDKEARRARKRAEGLKRQEEARRMAAAAVAAAAEANAPVI